MRLRQILSLVLTVAAARSACGQFATTVNDNRNTPAPPPGTLNIVPQNDGGRSTVNVSHYVLYPTIQVNCPASGDIGGPINAAIGIASTGAGGIIDARRCTGATTWTTATTISTANIRLLLPCATLTANQTLTVTAGTRYTRIMGCTYQGGSTANGTKGGTVINYSGSSVWLQVGDPTFAVDTQGFALSDLLVVTNGGAGAGVMADFFRTQEISLADSYFIGNGNDTGYGLYLDGTGNYTGGHFSNLHMSGFQYAIYLTGHDSGSVNGDYANASTFTKIHIDCPTSGGNPLLDTYAMYIAGGDGNTWSGGDFEGCGTGVRFGTFATNNTLLGVRNENSTLQFVADSHSQNNTVEGGSTIFTNELIDNGSRNSWRDSFHRAFNQLSGDTWASQADNTVTNHYRLGIGLGNERGQLTEYQTDQGNRWETGLNDGAGGSQSWVVHDSLNDVDRFSTVQYQSATPNVVVAVLLNNGGCYSSITAPAVAFSGGSGTGAAGTAVMGANFSPACNSGSGFTVESVTLTSGGSGYTSSPTVSFSGSNQVTAPNVSGVEIVTTGSTNNQTAVNGAGTGAVVLNGGTNSGTGGVIVASGGATPVEVAAINGAGDMSLFALGSTQNSFNMYANGVECWEQEWSATVFALFNACATTPARALTVFPNGQTQLNSQGTAAVVVNNTSTGGTGGLLVYGGGANSAVEEWGVSGSGVTQQAGNATIGSASGTGTLTVGNHLNQLGTGDFAGTCAMSSSTTCHVSLQHSYTAAVCFASDQATSPATDAKGAYYSAGDCYITASASNSDTWGCVCIGNPS